MTPAPEEVSVPLEHFHRLQELHRTELAEAHATVIRYRALLESNGIEPPDDAGKLGLAELRRLTRMGYALVMATDDFKKELGASVELLGERW